MPNMKDITFQPAARKALMRMPAPTAKRIVAKVEAYAENPASMANNVKTLRGTDAIRLRVRDWRVIVVETAVIDVIRIAPRGSAY